MFRISDSNNFRRTVAGVSLIAAPLAFGGADVIRLSIEGGTAEGSDQLAAIAANAGLWQAATILNLVGIVLFLPAILGLIHLLSSRGVALGHIGGGLALIGVLGWAAHNARYNSFMGAASTADNRQDMPAFIDHWMAVPETAAYVLMFVGAHSIGMLLLGIGLYRAHVTYNWAAMLILLGAGLSVVAGFSPFSEVTAAIATVHLITAVGLGATGFGVLSGSDADWARIRQADHAQAQVSVSAGAHPRQQAR